MIHPAAIAREMQAFPGIRPDIAERRIRDRAIINERENFKRRAIFAGRRDRGGER